MNKITEDLYSEELPLYGIPVLYSVYFEGLLSNKEIIKNESLYKSLMSYIKRDPLKLEITYE